MSICKIFVPYGAVGSGISEASFAAGIAMKPDAIASDAGSTDSGPYYLGTGQGKYARESVKEDLLRMVKAGNELKVPVLIGSAGTCGTDSGVDELSEICREICGEEKISAKLARIYTRQNPAVLKEKYAAGKIKPLAAAPPIDETVFDRGNIVGVAGAEPFQEALKQGASIVICGRATDTAIIAALPLMKGCHEAGAWHGAKIAECGSMCTTNPSGGGVFVTFDEEGFIVEPTSAESKCTVYSVSAHMLYENADPCHLREPSGSLDTSGSVYTRIDDRRVQVRGSCFFHEPYTIKLEGSALAGYQTVTFIGIQDRRVMEAPEKWLDMLGNYVDEKIKAYQFDSKSYDIDFKLYGLNAISGTPVPEEYVPREIGLMMTVTANTQKLATRIAKLYNPYLLHFPIKLDEQLPTYAFPFSPAETERGPVYKFTLNHAVEVSSPMELLRLETEEL